MVGEDGHNHFTEVRAGTGIEIRAIQDGTSNAITVSNVQEEQDADVVSLTVLPSVSRSNEDPNEGGSGTFREEFIRSNEFFAVGAGTDFAISNNASISFTAPVGDTPATLSFSYITDATTVSEPVFNVGDVVRFSVVTPVSYTHLTLPTKRIV